ncbi:MAG: RecX family transcriptional regulator [Patescibacteria group bacterium]
MPKVTSVEPQKKSASRRTHRFNIYLDGIFAFGADEDLIVDHRLVAGKEISPDDLEKLLQEAEVGKLMERMYRLFTIRQRSEKEVRDYLKNLSFKRKIKGEGEMSIFIVDAVVQLMKKKGMLDDKQFAIAWMESRLRKYGSRRIKQELLQKGINREIIAEVVSQQSSVNNQETAEKLLQKKIDRWKNLSPLELKKKSYEYLLRRGFEYEVVKSVIENFFRKM